MTIFRSSTFALACTAGLMQAAPAAAETVNGDRVYVIDGDTVAVQGKRQRIRLLDIDAPETYQPRCERERLLGLKAKARLVDLLRGRKVVIERRGIDTYGRALAHLKVNGKDIGRVLLREGHAVAWRPGRKAWDDRRRHWCGGR